MFEPYRLVLPIVWLMSILMSPLARSQSDPATIIATGNNRGAPACSQCHGADLNGSPAAQIPGLRGQSQAYLVEQLQNFADGKRHNPLMQMVVSHLDEADIHALAQYISSMPIHNLVSHRPKVPSLGKMLAEEGDPVAHIPACLSCHGPYGEGVAPYIPFVYGQPAPYLRTQLNAWHGGQRPDGFGRLMNNIALRLSPEMIESVSCYFAAFSADQKATSGCLIPVASHTDLGQEPENQVKSMQQKIIDQGQRIFDDTPSNASAYAWGGLSCQNCHLDHGLRAESAPLWAAYPIYPLYRKKNSRVITFAQRMQNCFVYSLNGKAPVLGDPIMVALEAYAQHVAHGQKIGVFLPQHGYPPLSKPALVPDMQRGQQVFVQHCALCHGNNGEGRRSHLNFRVFPPLWGDDSYNWGAGMSRYGTLARFVFANMPYTAAGTLSNQQAWDVAYFVDAHERPQDPRYTESVMQTQKLYHQQTDSLYGQFISEHQLGSMPLHIHP